MTTDKALPFFERKWTAAHVGALCIWIDLRVLGMSPSRASKAAKAGPLPSPVIKIGVQYIPLTASLVQVPGRHSGGLDVRPSAADLPRGGAGEQPVPTAASNGTAGH
jgi:hypothetical protein